jgi:replicative DNA helicase
VSRITGIQERAISLKGHYSELNESTNKIITHKGFSEREEKEILSALNQLAKLQLYIVEGNRSLDSIRRVVEKQIITTGCEMVFIDYLGLIREKQGKDGHDRMNYLSEELSRMPKEYRIPFKVLHQLNRDIERREGLERAPKIIDMREGGEESVDLLQMLCHCADNKYQSQLYIHKDRLRGETGVITVNWHSGSYS